MRDGCDCDELPPAIFDSFEFEDFEFLPFPMRDGCNELPADIFDSFIINSNLYIDYEYNKEIDGKQLEGRHFILNTNNTFLR